MIAKGYQSGETSFLTVFEYFFLVSVELLGLAALGRAARRARATSGIALIVAVGRA